MAVLVDSFAGKVELFSLLSFAVVKKARNSLFSRSDQVGRSSFPPDHDKLYFLTTPSLLSFSTRIMSSELEHLKSLVSQVSLDLLLFLARAS